MLLDPIDPRANRGEPPHRDAGRAWWQATAQSGETMHDVSLRLGMRVSEISAIKNGWQAPPETK
ncbi:hypothetical protein ACFSDD_09155 [Salipiger marinus]|uniref:hypothetical protein n=1 Tax=Salipiger marinus TaxID=555512 RepID=UPI002CDD03EE|nr:hypothetical protein [Salipiger manganoxidans]MEB3421894.1 hypothetical protein [Salipiger manganoxidans]